MIEILAGFPDDVVGLTGKGQVTRKDYEQTLIPAVEAVLTRHRKVRVYYELGPEFSGIDTGAAWEDLKLGVEHLSRWERMAVVTDVDWIRHMLNAFRFVMPGQMRVFPVASKAEARDWVLERVK